MLRCSLIVFFLLFLSVFCFLCFFKKQNQKRYPLYRRGINDPNDFANGVKLLKRDIYQLLLAAGIPPPYGRHVNADGAGILANLSYLMKRIFR